MVGDIDLGQSMEKWMFGESLTLSSTLKNQNITVQIKQADTHTRLTAIDPINKIYMNIYIQYVCAPNMF